jgi:hypothetical protein
MTTSSAVGSRTSPNDNGVEFIARYRSGHLGMLEKLVAVGL